MLRVSRNREPPCAIRGRERGAPVVVRPRWAWVTLCAARWSRELLASCTLCALATEVACTAHVCQSIGVNCSHYAVIAQEELHVSRKKRVHSSSLVEQLSSRTLFDGSEAHNVDPPYFPNPVAAHGCARGGELLCGHACLPCCWALSATGGPRCGSSSFAAGNTRCGSSSAAHGAWRSPTGSHT